jgi:hypothetical protein
MPEFDLLGEPVSDYPRLQRKKETEVKKITASLWDGIAEPCVVIREGRKLITVLNLRDVVRETEKRNP